MHKLLKPLFYVLPMLSIAACNGAGNVVDNSAGSDIMANNSLIQSSLAKPTGQYGVGYHDIHLLNTDLGKDKYATSDNQDDFSPDNPQQIHEMMLRVYYPTLSKIEPNGSYYKPLLDGFKQQLDALSKTISKQQLAQYAAAIDSIKTFAAQDDQNFTTGQKFPVIIFSPGAGVNLEAYENFITNLASHGYIVVGINSVFMSGNVELPDGHVVKLDVPKNPTPEEYRDFLLNKFKPEQAGDFKYVLNNLKPIVSENMPELASQTNFNSIGAFGHSIGAAIIVNYLHANPNTSKLKAAASLDVGVDYKGKEDNSYDPVTNIPFMHQVAAQRFDPSIIKIEKDLGVYLPDFSRIGNNGYVVIHRNSKTDYSSTFHMNFSDYSTLATNEGIKAIIENQGNHTVGTEDGWEFTKLANNYLLSFFNIYLKDLHNNNDAYLTRCEALSHSIDIRCNTPQ